MRDESELGKKIQDELDRVISGTVSKIEGSIVNKWIAIVEILDQDGDIALWTFVSDSTKAWDTMGMLEYGLLIQKVALEENRRE